MMNILRAAAAGLLLLPFAIGCSDNTTEPATDRITVIPDVSTASLMPGATTTVSVTVSRPDGFAGPVTLTTENLPSGVTATFAPATLASDETVSTLTLTADAGAPSGQGSLTVRASGTDVQSEAAVINVAVGTVASTRGSFTLTVSPSALTVTKGASATSLVAIDRQGGFTGAVALSINGFPSGIFATVTPGSLSASIGIINISVDNTVAAGSYTATVSATGDDVDPQSASLTITIMPALQR